MIQTINLKEKLTHVTEFWHPGIVGELNDSYLKVAKLKGEFIWHHHDTEDELFMVLKGRLVIQLREGDVTINEGEFAIIPHGVEHKPVAEEETHVLLMEPKSTRNTGTENNERTVEPDWL
ncbi:mannose-6-phosphate isomerase [Leptolinea sp. HRD-7]|nr:mannose-6-phosphate isomerase [Leptolinea sp. HRD-7]